MQRCSITVNDHQPRLNRHSHIPATLLPLDQHEGCVVPELTRNLTYRTVLSKPSLPSGRVLQGHVTRPRSKNLGIADLDFSAPC